MAYMLPRERQRRGAGVRGTIDRQAKPRVDDIQSANGMSLPS